MSVTSHTDYSLTGRGDGGAAGGQNHSTDTPPGANRHQGPARRIWIRGTNQGTAERIRQDHAGRINAFGTDQGP